MVQAVLGRDDETVDYPMGVRQSARIAFPDGCTARYGSGHSVCILDHGISLCSCHYILGLRNRQLRTTEVSIAWKYGLNITENDSSASKILFCDILSEGDTHNKYYLRISATILPLFSAHCNIDNSNSQSFCRPPRLRPTQTQTLLYISILV